MYDEDDNEISTTTSGVDGVVTFGDVQYDTYMIKETKASTGYIMSTSTMTATISLNGQIVILSKVVNQMVEIDKPKTTDNVTPYTGDSNVNSILIISSVGLLLLFGCLVVERKMLSNKN